MLCIIIAGMKLHSPEAECLLKPDSILIELLLKLWRRTLKHGELSNLKHLTVIRKFKRLINVKTSLQNNNLI